MGFHFLGKGVPNFLFVGLIVRKLKPLVFPDGTHFLMEILNNRDIRSTKTHSLQCVIKILIKENL